MIFSRIARARTICRGTILIMILYSTFPDASAYSRMANALVRSIDGLPCFTVSKKEETRHGPPLLVALVIADHSIEPVRKVWSFTMPYDEALPLQASSCILYGELPDRASGIAAKKLVPGHLYRVFLNGRSNDPSDPTLGYVAKFCIVMTDKDTYSVLAINDDSAAWKTEICPTTAPLK